VLMRRAIDNLLENAHKYTPDPALPITLRARNGSAGVEIAIVDQGVGIAPEDLDRVFRPFFRVERSRTRSAGGTGLGLTLAKRIIEAHGGTICIESEGRGGSTARLVIPYGLADG
jgi:two-component system, OmpR family, sensor kinase